MMIALWKINVSSEERGGCLYKNQRELCSHFFSVLHGSVWKKSVGETKTKKIAVKIEVVTKVSPAVLGSWPVRCERLHEYGSMNYERLTRVLLMHTLFHIGYHRHIFFGSRDLPRGLRNYVEMWKHVSLSFVHSLCHFLFTTLVKESPTF